MKLILLFLLTIIIYYSWIYRFRIKLRFSPSKQNIITLAKHTERQLKNRLTSYSNKVEALTFLSMVTHRLELKDIIEIQERVQWFINLHKDDLAVNMVEANFLFTRIFKLESVDEKSIEMAHKLTGHLDQHLFEQLLPHYRDALFYHLAIQLKVYYRLNDISRSEDILNKVKEEFIFDKFSKYQQRIFFSYEEGIQKSINEA